MTQAAKFILIDHSLKYPGGHDYEFATRILSAAEHSGYQPILAAHVRFASQSELPSNWQTYSIFRRRGYHRYRLSLGPDSPPCLAWNRTGVAGEDKPLSWWDRQQSRWHRWLQKIRIDDLQRGCTSLLRKTGIASGDHIFFPTFTPFDLLGLVPSLAAIPKSAHAHVHLEFHDEYLRGDRNDLPLRDAQRHAVREHFRQLLAQIPHHQLHFYAVTESLVQQYQELGLAPFELLRYPVSPTLLARRLSALADQDGSATRRLRVACPNTIRDPDHSDFISRMLNTLVTEPPTTPEFQLLIRAKKKRYLPREPIMPPSAHQSGDAKSSPQSVIRIPSALSPQAYEEHVARTDMGLFLYDRKAYEVKCSGILTEMLSVGIPVIVPAGCWLGDQFQEKIYQHLERLPSTAKLVETRSARELDWTNSLASPIDTKVDTKVAADLRIGTDGDTVAAELQPPSTATDILVRFRLCEALPRLAGYVRWQADCFDETGKLLERVASVGGPRENHSALFTLLALPRGTMRLRLEARNAFANTSLRLAETTLFFLASNQDNHAHCPAGAVGLTTADASQTARLLGNMLEHYAHFQSTAHDFAAEYGRLHDPAAILTQMLCQTQRAQSMIAKAMAVPVRPSRFPPRAIDAA